MSRVQESKGEDVLVVGRIVWTAGDLFAGRTKVDQNDPMRKPKLNKEGQPITEYGFGLAVSKTELNNPNGALPFWQALHRQAFELFPSQQVPPGFGWKYKDGDGVDHNGVPFNQREGYPGCYVFALTTTWKPQFFRKTNGVFTQIVDGIKCGDYVQVQVNVVAHGAEGNMKAGMYLNPKAVQFIGYGDEIINRPSADQIFGNGEVPLPPGASSVPVAGNGFMVPPTGQVVQPQAMPGMPAPAQAPYQQPPVQQTMPAPQGVPGMPTGFPPTGFPQPR